MDSGSASYQYVLQVSVMSVFHKGFLIEDLYCDRIEDIIVA